MFIEFSIEDPIEIEKETPFEVLAIAIPESNETIINRFSIDNRPNPGVSSLPDKVNGQYIELYPNIIDGIEYLKKSNGGPLEYGNETEWDELGDDVETVVIWEPNRDEYELFSYEFVIDYILQTGSGPVLRQYRRTMVIYCVNTWYESRESVKDFFEQ